MLRFDPVCLFHLRNFQSDQPLTGAIWLDCINLVFVGRLTDIEYHAVWVSDVTARDRRIFLYHGATGGDQLPLGGLNVWNKKVEHRCVIFVLFHVQTKSTGLKTDDRFRPLCDRKTEDLSVKVQRLRPVLSSNDNIS